MLHQVVKIPFVGDFSSAEEFKYILCVSFEIRSCLKDPLIQLKNKSAYENCKKIKQEHGLVWERLHVEYHHGIGTQ